MPLLDQQFAAPKLSASDRIVNVSGGIASARSLRQLTEWCDDRFSPHPVAIDSTPRAFDIAWIVLDHAKATRLWKWQPLSATPAVLQEIAIHAQAHPDWLDISAPL